MDTLRIDSTYSENENAVRNSKNIKAGTIGLSSSSPMKKSAFGLNSERKFGEISNQVQNLNTPLSISSKQQVKAKSTEKLFKNSESRKSATTEHPPKYGFGIFNDAEPESITTIDDLDDNDVNFITHEYRLTDDKIKSFVNSMFKRPDSNVIENTIPASPIKNEDFIFEYQTADKVPEFQPTFEPMEENIFDLPTPMWN